MTALTARALEYRIGDATLVAGLDLDIHEGEVVAIVGPNGAGKSTLIGLLAGDISPTAGAVLVDGDPLSAIPTSELALRRAVLPQKQIADVPFTAAAVVAMGRFPHRVDPDNTRAKDLEAVRQALVRTDATHLADRVVATLSGGERTQVAFARVLAQTTGLMLLDEPTTALDVAHQERILAEVLVQARGGRAVVTVLHDLNAAAFYADRIILMAGGAVVSDGSPREVLDGTVLSRIYDQPMEVIDHPFRDCPLVLVGRRPNPLLVPTIRGDSPDV